MFVVRVVAAVVVIDYSSSSRNRIFGQSLKIKSSYYRCCSWGPVINFSNKTTNEYYQAVNEAESHSRIIDQVITPWFLSASLFCFT